MKLIIKMQYGSHLFGTNLPTSDQDFKGVFLPDAKDILLVRTDRVLQKNIKNSLTAKNNQNDVDFEVFALHFFVKLLLNGQTTPFEMLFAPKKFYQSQPDPLWSCLVGNRDKFLHANITSFAGYCENQAKKYCVKGVRLKVLDEAIALLKGCNPSVLLEEVWQEILDFVKREGSKSLNAVYQSGTSLANVGNFKPHPLDPLKRSECYVEILGRKFASHTSVKNTLQRLEKIRDQYGHRSKSSKENNGADWKALMHALRICNEAIELVRDGFITLPRPEKQLLLAIRTGNLPYEEVIDLIEEGLFELKREMSKSSLPLHPDRAFAEDFVANGYFEHINDSFSQGGKE